MNKQRKGGREEGNKGNKQAEDKKKKKDRQYIRFSSLKPSLIFVEIQRDQR